MATQDLIIPSHVPIGEAPRDLDAIAAQETGSPFPYWNATTAFQLGIALRTRLLTFDKPTVIHISTVSTPAHVLFHSVSAHAILNHPIQKLSCVLSTMGLISICR
jgi:hypothetical protein